MLVRALYKTTGVPLGTVLNLLSNAKPVPPMLLLPPAHVSLRLAIDLQAKLC